MKFLTAAAVLALVLCGGTMGRAAVGTLADSSGEVVGWGSNFSGQTTVPANGTFTFVAAGGSHSLAIRSDGSLAGWGSNGVGQTTVPTTGTFTAVAAGAFHSLAIRSDGSLAGWGSNDFGQTTVPSGTFTAIAAADYHSLALRARTSYEGDLVISGSGMTTNLNRSITVAGNMAVQAPINFYNAPTVTVVGKVTFAPSTGLVGNGTIIAGNLELLGNSAINQGLAVNPGQEIATTGGISGTGGLFLINAGAHVQLGLGTASTWTGKLSIAEGASVTVTGQGSQAAGSLRSGEAIATIPTPTITPGGELRMGAGQYLRFTSTTALLGSPLYASPNYNGGASEIEFIGEITNAPSTGLITGRDAVLRFTGGLTNYGAVTLTRGANDVFGDITNQAGASMVVTGGATATFYDDITQNGTLQIAKFGSTTSSAVFLGAFTGSGGYTGGGDAYFAGDLRPGNSPASVTLGGNVGFGPAAELNIELAGMAAGSQYDRVNVTGGLALDGALRVTLAGGFTPAAGNTFDILNWGTIGGAFSTVSLPAIGGELEWDTSALYSTGTLKVVAAVLPGDYNHNGVVDGADYVLWRKRLGTTYGQNDYNVWRSHFGQTQGSGNGSATGQSQLAAVPEPTPLLLALVVVAGLATNRGRR